MIPGPETQGLTQQASWSCPDCKECRYCLSFKDRDKMVSCIECKNLIHLYCIFNLGQSVQVNPATFKCDDCLKCHNCEAVIEDDNYMKPNQEHDSRNIKICSSCSPLYSIKQYCPVCMTAYACKIKNFKAKKCVKDLFYCDCGFWIHENCDPLLRRNLDNINKARSKEACYNCPHCRTEHKMGQTLTFIQILTMLDLKTLFTEVVLI